MRGRMRDFPKELVIGQSVWRVRFRRVLNEGADWLGSCDPETKTIEIKMGQTRAERVSTFLHEVLHSCEHEFKIEIPHSLIYKIEGPLAQIFMQNAWVQWAEWEAVKKELSEP